MPEFLTQKRALGQSAVGLAACLLRRQATDHHARASYDFRQWDDGTRLVRSMILGPEGAPPWVADPDQLWNRVERAEAAEDAQVARYINLPVPPGCDEGTTFDLAMRLGRYMLLMLETPVMGALFATEPAAATPPEADPAASEAPTYQLHFMLPMRRLLPDDGPRYGRASIQGFGPVLAVALVRKVEAALQVLLEEAWLEQNIAFTQPLTLDRLAA